LNEKVGGDGVEVEELEGVEEKLEEVGAEVEAGGNPNDCEEGDTVKVFEFGATVG